MKLLYAKLHGYIGLYQGSNIKDIEIKFGDSRITVIRGRNGSGKSTLADALGPFPDANSYFIPGESASKELHYLVNNSYTVIIKILHPVNGKGERSKTEAYIKKQTPNGYEELNPTGNVSSYKDILYSEFRLDPCFMSLSKLSTEDKGLVEKTPAERKKFVSATLTEVESYNEMNKTFNKRGSIYTSLMNNITAKINGIGDSLKIKQQIELDKAKFNSIEKDMAIFNDKIAESKATIQVLDPNNEIQNSYNEARLEYTKAETSINKLVDQISFIFKSVFTDLDIEEYTNKEKCLELFSAKKLEISRLKDKVESTRAELEEMFTEKEDNSKHLQRLSQQLESLQSEYNFTELQNQIEVYKKNIEEYQAFFESIHVDGLSLSKDEYLTGLNTLHDIKDMIDVLKSSYSTGVIQKAVDAVNSNSNIISKYDNMKKELKNTQVKLREYEEKKSYYEGLFDKTLILNNRPKECKINSCAFIEDALKAAEENPAENYDEYRIKISILQSDIENLEYNMSVYDEIISCVRDLNMIIKNISMYKTILKKLPIDTSFYDANELMRRIVNMEDFREIDELYKYIDYANVFEMYKVTKDSLYKAETDYKIYESKNIVIENISRDIDRLLEETRNITRDIDIANDNIAKWNKIILDSEDYFNTLSALIDLLDKLDIATKNMEQSKMTMATLEANMDKIQVHLSHIDEYQKAYTNASLALAPIKESLEQNTQNLRLLDSYTEELSRVSENYEYNEVLRTYCTPTKKGIQNIFIAVYMNQTRNLTNQLLSNLFGGRMQLLPYRIEENEFAIPCLSMNTGLVTDDISSCSRSEKSIISMIIGFVLLMQSSTLYNILRLDEIDEGLDTSNRLMFTDTLNYLMDILKVQQCIFVSHTVELNMSNVDIIQLAPVENDMYSGEGNVIFSV